MIKSKRKKFNRKKKFKVKIHNERVELFTNDSRYTISLTHNKMISIHKMSFKNLSDRIIIQPVVSNVIEIK